MSEDNSTDQDHDEVVHALGEAFLGFLGHMAREAENAPAVAEIPESPIPDGKTPEQFMEKAFQIAKDELTKRGIVNPAIFSFKKGGLVHIFMIKNCPGGEFISRLTEEIVKNDTPEAYGIVMESWYKEMPPNIDPKYIVPPSMDPNAKEAIVGMFKGKETFQLIQTFRHDESDHNKIIFEGEMKKLGGEIKAGRPETEGINVPIHDPTRDYIG